VRTVRSQPAAAAERDAGQPQVLVIEDDLAAVQLIEAQLTSAGYQPVLCKDPARAVELAVQTRPAAITLDLLMKPTSGLDVLVRLKNDPRTRSIPVIVITIVEQPGIGALLGADEYLVKPVEKPVLLAAVRRCLGARQDPAASQPILVVEDDAPTREAILDLLRAERLPVVAARDGAEARQAVRAAPPALVLLDLMLPQVSGFELLAEWRAHPHTADMPVFVLTGKDLDAGEEAFLKAHTESLFRKQQPWGELLLGQLRRVIGQGDGVGAASCQPHAGAV
jgi:CheY-like chemotaxis protein